MFLFWRDSEPPKVAQICKAYNDKLRHERLAWRKILCLLGSLLSLVFAVASLFILFSCSNYWLEINHVAANSFSVSQFNFVLGIGTVMVVAVAYLSYFLGRGGGTFRRLFWRKPSTSPRRQRTRLVHRILLPLCMFTSMAVFGWLSSHVPIVSLTQRLGQTTLPIALIIFHGLFCLGFFPWLAFWFRLHARLKMVSRELIEIERSAKDGHRACNPGHADSSRHLKSKRTREGQLCLDRHGDKTAGLSDRLLIFNRIQSGSTDEPSPSTSSDLLAADITPAPTQELASAASDDSGSAALPCCTPTKPKPRLGLSIYRIRLLSYYAATALGIGFLLFFFSLPLWLDTAHVLASNTVQDVPAKPKMIAHRGLVARAPENSLAAMSLALKSEAVWAIESDIFFSRDCVPFAMHDETFIRTTNVKVVFPARAKEPVQQFLWSDIQKLDCGSWFSTEFANERIPALESILLVLKQYPDKKFIFDLRVPEQDHPCYNATNATLLHLFRATGTGHQIIHLDLNESIRQEFPTTYQAVGVNHRSEQPSTFKLLTSKLNMINAEPTVSNVYLRNMSRSHHWTNMYHVNEAWLFSQAWCLGLKSVTSNCPESFYAMKAPIYYFSSETYRNLCMAMTFASIASIFVWILVFKAVRLLEDHKGPSKARVSCE